jgi:predicted permease
VRVWFEEPGATPRVSLSIPDFADFGRVAAFDRFVGTARVRVVTLSGQGTERLRGEAVQPHYFELLGVRPLVGRLLQADDHAPGAPPALVLSHGAWQRLYGGDPRLVGRELRTARAVYTIVGVAEPGFDGSVEDDLVEFVIPIQHYEPRALQTDRTSRASWAIARLAPGATMADADAQASAIGRSIAEAYPLIYRRWRVRVEPMGESWREGLRGGGTVLFLASAALLVIAALNVGCLLLARVLDRRREFALRASLGADGRRIAIQVFLEAAMLVAAGGLVGALLGPPLLEAALAFSPVALPRYVPLSPDGWTLALSAFTLALAGLVAGTLPALLGRRVQPGDVLREGGRGGIGRRRERRWTALLVGAETALTLVLLVAGGLLLRSFDRLDSIDLGFDRARIGRLAVTLTAADTSEPAQFSAIYDRLREAIRRLPGVERVGLVSTTLPPWDADRGRVALQDPPIDPDSPAIEAGLHFADSGLLPMLGVPIAAGRNLSESDAEGAVPVAVISQSLARPVGGADRAVGRTLRLAATGRSPERTYRVIGVAADVAWDGLVDDRRRFVPYVGGGDAKAARFDVYLSLLQHPQAMVSVGFSTTGDPTMLIEPARQAISTVAPASAVHWTSTMDDEVALEYASSRFYTLIVGFFSVSALAVTSIGLFALLSRAAARRMSEMGLRVALGATPRTAARLLLTNGFTPVAVGVAVGLLGAVVTARLLQELLYGVLPFDSVSFAAAGTLVVAVALCAGLVPARRILRVDPMTTLRAE